MSSRGQWGEQGPYPPPAPPPGCPPARRRGFVFPGMVDTMAGGYYGGTTDQAKGTPMTATMKPNRILPNGFDVRCDECGLDIRGYAYTHAATVVREHNAESHPIDPDTAFLTRAAREVLAAWKRRDDEHDLTWGLAQMALWETLTGLEHDAALEYARRLDAHGEVTAHVAPF